MQFTRSDGVTVTATIEIDDIIEAEKSPGFNFLKTISGLGEASFTDWYYLAGLVSIDGEKLGYREMVARGYTLIDLSNMLGGIASDLGFTSENTV